MKASWIGWLVVAACGSAGAQPATDRAPSLPAEDKAAVMRVARGLLDALWTGGNPDDVPGAVLRNRKHMVGVTVRRNGVMLGRGQAGAANLLDGLRESVALAVAEAKGGSPHAAAKPAELRLEVELAGDPVPIRFRHQVAGPAEPEAFQLTADTLAAKVSDGLPAAVAQKLMVLQKVKFASEKDLAGRIAEVLEPAEFERHKSKLLAGSHFSLAGRVAADIVEQCRRGLDGLLIEFQTSKRGVVQGITFPGEVITDNINPVGFLARTLLRAKVPAHLTPHELRKLVDADIIRAWRFRSIQLVETDAKGAFWEPVRGHRPVGADEVRPDSVASAVNGLTGYCFYRTVRQSAMMYYPSIDMVDTAADTPMERAIVGWGLAEAARRLPADWSGWVAGNKVPVNKRLLGDAAGFVLGGMKATLHELMVPGNPADAFVQLIVPGGAPLPAPKASPKADPAYNFALSVLREPTGEAAHLGSISMAALGMTRLPPGKARSFLTGSEPDEVVVNGEKFRFLRARERMLVAIVWMQNRTAIGPDPRNPLAKGAPVGGWKAGSFRTWFPPSQQFPGEDRWSGHALQALANYHAETGDPKALDRIREAFRCYEAGFRENPEWNLAAWQLPAFALTAEKAADADMARLVLAMGDRLLVHQTKADAGGEPDLIGGFPPDGKSHLRPAATTAVCVIALCSAAETAARLGDRKRSDDYAAAIRAGVRHLLQLQFKPEEMYYVREPALAERGIRAEVGDNGISQVNCALSLIALLRATDVLWPAGR